MRWLVSSSIFLFSCFSFSQIHHNGHAHNDYLKNHPLNDALQNGFTSIEVDVFDVNGEVRVAHFPFFLAAKPSLKELYLKPLKLRIQANGGTVFKEDSTQLILMIELKRNHAELLKLIHIELNAYRDLIDIPRGKNKRWGPIKILLTGGVSADLISSDELGYFSIDGGWGTLKKGAHSPAVQRISMNYATHFNWKGKGSMPAEEKEWLINTISQVNELGCELRFWNMPNKQVIWEAFLKVGVHRLNIDDYYAFSEFIANRAQ